VCARAFATGSAGTGGIYSSACDGRTDACAFAICDLSEIHVAAGATWKLLIASAPWAARHSHTSAIDAAGAIYVIGGRGGTFTVYNDAWMSTDGGVDRALGATRRLL
jgi:hypothetical protein